MAFLSAGTCVTSCTSCHPETTGSQSCEQGRALACVCKDGFVGEGLTSYDPKICSDSSCCNRGYHWFAEKGCVNNEECSFSNSPCTSFQICYNTPGSYKCLELSSNTRLSVSSQSVLIPCGNTVCPSGMDCINSQYVDPVRTTSHWMMTAEDILDIHCDRGKKLGRLVSPVSGPNQCSYSNMRWRWSQPWRCAGG